MRPQHPTSDVATEPPLPALWQALADKAGWAWDLVHRRMRTMAARWLTRRGAAAQDIDDVVQAAAMLLDRKVSSMGPPASLDAILVWQLRAALTEHQRRDARWRGLVSLDEIWHAFGEDEHASAGGGDGAEWAAFVRRAFHECVEGLNEDQRRAWVERFGGKWKAGAIAQLLGMPAAKVRMALHRGALRLRDCLEGRGVRVRQP